MENRVRELVAQIALLEDELRTALHEKEARIGFTFRGKRVEFERNARELHERVRRNFFRWLATDRPQNLLTGPVIYAMAVPMAMLDFFVTFYQATCFPIYGIAKVRRGDYIAFDRHRLGYLNFVERFHCEYCAYANGLLAYATQVVARTEQYFCPIKHARKILGQHALHRGFLAFGDSDDYHAKLEAYRRACADFGETPAA